MKRFSISACVALAAVSVACSQGIAPQDGSGEAVGVTSEAMSTAPKPSETLMCTDCFEETNGGGPGTPSGLGSNGFTGGTVGWANGTTSRAAPAGGCKDQPPDPDVECVEVHGEPRPLKDSDYRVLITGRESDQVVALDVPRRRGLPTSVSAPPDAPGARVWKCAMPGVPCQAECAKIGAYCDFERQHPQDPDKWSSNFGLLTGCKSNRLPNLTHTCSYRYSNGDICTEIWPFGAVGAFLCDKAMP